MERRFEYNMVASKKLEFHLMALQFQRYNESRVIGKENIYFFSASCCIQHREGLYDGGSNYARIYKSLSALEMDFEMPFSFTDI